MRVVYVGFINAALPQETQAMKTTTEQIATITEMLAYAEAKAEEWGGKGDAAKKGSATRRESWAASERWRMTAETLREELETLKG